VAKRKARGSACHECAPQKIPAADHAFTCGTPRSASAIFSAGYS